MLRTFDCSVVPRSSHWAYLNPVPTTMRVEVFLPLGNSRFHPPPASVQTVLLISFPSQRPAKFTSSASHVSHMTDFNPTTQLSGRPSFHTQHRAAPRHRRSPHNITDPLLPGPSHWPEAIPVVASSGQVPGCFSSRYVDTPRVIQFQLNSSVEGENLPCEGSISCGKAR